MQSSSQIIHQQTNTQLFRGRMSFLLPNQQCQSTEGKCWPDLLMFHVSASSTYLCLHLSLYVYLSVCLSLCRYLAVKFCNTFRVVLFMDLTDCYDLIDWLCVCLFCYTISQISKSKTAPKVGIEQGIGTSSCFCAFGIRRSTVTVTGCQSTQTTLAAEVMFKNWFWHFFRCCTLLICMQLFFHKGFVHMDNMHPHFRPTVLGQKIANCICGFTIVFLHTIKSAYMACV